jgi:hypothetical protein
MAVISAIFVDHLLTDGQHIGLTTVGLVGFLPATALYAYLMLSQKGLEPWSWRAEREQACFDWLCLRETAADKLGAAKV